MRKITDIETKLSGILWELGIAYRREFRLGTYPVDFYIKSHKLSIQADGCYHHGCLVCYKDKKLEPRQKRQSLKDKACLAYHKYHRINIIRINGCEILNNSPAVANLIVDAMKKIDKGEYVFLHSF